MRKVQCMTFFFTFSHWILMALYSIRGCSDNNGHYRKWGTGKETIMVILWKIQSIGTYCSNLENFSWFLLRFPKFEKVFIEFIYCTEKQNVQKHEDANKKIIQRFITDELLWLICKTCQLPYILLKQAYLAEQPLLLCHQVSFALIHSPPSSSTNFSCK